MTYVRFMVYKSTQMKAEQKVNAYKQTLTINKNFGIALMKW